jgi:hypothetical protein
MQLVNLVLLNLLIEVYLNKKINKKEEIFMNWAKENDIPVGPGRGSGAGSLVAYSMKITDLDPLPYNLYFERFLNPDRSAKPDIDFDCMQGSRERIREYLESKYPFLSRVRPTSRPPGLVRVRSLFGSRPETGDPLPWRGASRPQRSGPS